MYFMNIPFIFHDIGGSFGWSPIDSSRNPTDQRPIGRPQRLGILVAPNMTGDF